MRIFRSLRLLLQGPTPQQMAAQLRKPHGFLARKVGRRMNAANRTLYEGAWKALDLRTGMRVLEIGFGNGLFFADLWRQAPGLQLCGLDFSKEMVDQATANNASLIASGALALVLGPSDGMPFPDACFDRVFCINVVYFWEDPVAHLREIHRVLRPGGTFTAVLRTRSSMRHLPFTAHGFTMYEREEWEAVLRAAGLIPVSTTVRHDPEITIAGSRLRQESLIVVAARN